MNLREADLTRHLSNPKESDTPAEKPTKVIAPPEKDKSDAKEKGDERAAPIELGTKADYQFTQAMNLLKGLQILQKK